MPDIGASSFEDFAAAESFNTRVRFDGRVELSSRNGLANPDLRDLVSDPDAVTEDIDAGLPEGVTLGSAEAPAGWGVYVRKTGSGEAENILSRQNTGPFPMRRDKYAQDGPLVQGPEPQDVTRRAKIAPPVEVPDVEVVARNVVGYSGAKPWRALSYAWIVGPNLSATDRLTAPAPRTYVQLLEGQVVSQSLPDAMPEGATGLAILMTEGQDTQNQAASAPLWEQRRIPVSRSIPPNYFLRGPFRKERRAPTANRTYVGGAGRWPAPKRLFTGGRGTLPVLSTQLSFSFLTEFGWSMPQGIAPITTTAERPRTVITWYPRKLPPGTKAWRPEFTATDGLWYALPARAVTQVASIGTNRIETGSDGGQGAFRFAPEQFSRNRFEGDGDQSGMPDPDSPLEEPVAAGAAAIEPGNYGVRTVFYDWEGRETTIGPFVVVRVEAGQTFHVYRPAAGNLIPNASRVSFDPLANKPEGWEFPRLGTPTPNLTVTENRASVTVKDSSGVTINEDVALTPKAIIAKMDHNVLRTVVRFTRYFSGRIDLVARFFEGGRNGAYIASDAVLRRITGLGAGGVDQVVKVRLVGPGKLTGNPNFLEIERPANARLVRIAARVIGSGTEGQRNFDAELTSFGVLRGLAAPPRAGWNRTPVRDTEEEEYEYPEGGACILVTEPKDLHPDVAALSAEINAVRYFGPEGTPSDPENFLTGYATPVRAGQVKTLSCYAGWEGVTKKTAYFGTVFKDARGRTLRANPALTGPVLGDSPEQRRVLTLPPAPAGTSYLEIVSGGGSDGQARAYAFQLDDGPVATPYTNRNALSGWRRVTVDTGVPGFPDAGAGYLAHVAAIPPYGWRGAKVIATEEEGTRVDASYRSTEDDPLTVEPSSVRWSPWTADFAAVPRRRYWQIEAALFTDDDRLSPVVDNISLEVTRLNGVMLTASGSEYTGGMQAYEVTALHGSRIREGFVSDSNERTERRRGVRRTRVKFGLQGYLDAGVEDFLKGLDEDGSVNVIEDHKLGWRYTVRVDPESVEFQTAREGYSLRNGYGAPNRPEHWIHTAESVEAEVLSREPF